MKAVRLLVSRVGTGFAQSPGEVIRVPDDEAERLVLCQAAELVETAALDIAGNVEKRNRRKRDEQSV